jgi:hypothetical protein
MKTSSSLPKKIFYIIGKKPNFQGESFHKIGSKRTFSLSAALFLFPPQMIPRRITLNFSARGIVITTWY